MKQPVELTPIASRAVEDLCTLRIMIAQTEKLKSNGQSERACNNLMEQLVEMKKDTEGVLKQEIPEPDNVKTSPEEVALIARATPNVADYPENTPGAFVHGRNE